MQLGKRVKEILVSCSNFRESSRNDRQENSDTPILLNPNHDLLYISLVTLNMPRSGDTPPIVEVRGVQITLHRLYVETKCAHEAPPSLTPHTANCGANPVGTSWGRVAGVAWPENDPRKAWALFFPPCFVAPPPRPVLVEPGFSRGQGEHHIYTYQEDGKRLTTS